MLNPMVLRRIISKDCSDRSGWHGRMKFEGGKDRFCQKHQEAFKEMEFQTYVCQSCYREEDNAIEEKVRLARRQKKAEDALKLPKRLKKQTFEAFKADTPERRESLGECLKYVQEWPNVGGAIIVGSVGTGKTHLVIAMCQALRDRKSVICRYTNINRIVRHVRSSWGKNSEQTEQEVVKKYLDCELLVIDEIGSQYGSDSERIIINEIINDRYEDERPTIIVGNVSIKEAANILGERIIDRIKDNGIAISMNWESYRQIKKDL